MATSKRNVRMKMPMLGTVGLLLGSMAMAAPLTRVYGAADLGQNFTAPPASAKPSCFWWWFNSLVDKEAITHDLEEFKSKGMGGVMLVCSGNDYGVGPMPRGPVFLSPEWRELYKHAVKECARLDLELGVNFCGGGWCMGGSWIKPEFSSRWYVQSLTNAVGPGKFQGQLPVPGHRDGYEGPYFGNVTHYMRWPKEKADYRDTVVVAFREADDGASDLGPERRKLLAGKSNRKDASLFTPVAKIMEMTLPVWPSLPGDKPVEPNEVIDLTSKLQPDGTLDWEVPPGRWTVQRIGHVLIGCDVRCILPEGDPKTWLEVDWLNPDAVDEMFANLGKILIEDAGEHVGKTLKYLHTDSFEDGFPNWTGKILEKFKGYRGYDPTPYLPVLAGKIVGSAEVSDRFLYDYRKTVADCIADGNYGRFAKRAAEHGLEIQCEAGGPSWSGSVCMDALKNLGRCGRPMGEFWMDSLNVSKQTACAAHIYGKRTASAESFTGGGHWTDTPGSRKPFGDRAFCDGVNRYLFHTMTCQRPQDGKPGYEYGAPTHFNPNVTWWDQAAGPWLGYVNRCQAMLQSGLFVADVLLYYGDWAPNRVDPKPIAGYDYDVCNAEVLLTRLTVKDCRLVLPDGMSYRYLVLPDNKRMPVEVARKIEELVKAGSTIIGPRPESDPGLRGYPQCDDSVKAIASSLWENVDGNQVKERKDGKGRVIWGKDVVEVMKDDGLKPDFEIQDASGKTDVGFIHRATAESDFYFLANRKPNPETVEARFRIVGRQPELWDPVTGAMRKLPEFSVKDGCTILPLRFEPHQSWFVVFRKKVAEIHASRAEEKNFPDLKSVQEITGAWELQFDPKWFYDQKSEVGDQRSETGAKLAFETLTDWTKRPEEAIQYYSGTAVYRNVFDFAADAGNRDQGSGVNSAAQASAEIRTLNPQSRLFLDLGVVKETAKIKLNGKDLGVVWCAPWRVEITDAVKEKENELEIEVVNLWPNRLIGDGKLPENRRRTHTNVLRYYRPSPKGEHQLLPSGLLGPVTIQAIEGRAPLTQ